MSSNIVFIGGQPFLAQQWAQPTIVINNSSTSNHWAANTRSSFCSGCGKPQLTGDKFCSGCGKRL